MEKVITENNKNKLMLSDENCDNVSITIDRQDRDLNTKRLNKINLSKRQVHKLIDELKMFL